jgi:O-antigen/teichoic acid export membrane protein
MRGRLEVNVVASALNALAVIASSLVAVPLILDAVGTRGFGVWALGVAIVVYASLADAGLGPAVQRFTAVAKGAGDAAAATRMLWTALLAYAVVGAIALVALLLLAAPLVDLFDLSRGLRDDAETMFRTLGFAVAAGLLASGAGHLLAGVERFPALAVTSAAGAVAFVIGVALLAAGHGLPGIALALVAQQAVVLLARLWALRGLIGRPTLAGSSEFAAMIRFSLPLQASALADLLNQQSDKIVVALTASLVTVGQLGIGAQFADGGRLVAAAALGPLISTLAVAAGARDRELLIERFTPIHRAWVLGLLGVGLVGVGALDPLIEAWLGPGHHEAAVLGAILVLATVIGLTTGSGAAYLRAIGQPGLEARYGILVLCANTALTVPLAIAVGARGVVLGTLGAYLTGALWFFSRLGRAVPVSPVRDGRDAAGAVGMALAAGAVTLLLGRLAVAALPGRLALVPVVAVALAMLAAYAALVLRLRMSPQPGGAAT